VLRKYGMSLLLTPVFATQSMVYSVVYSGVYFVNALDWAKPLM